MCQVHTGAYLSLLAPGKTDYIARYPRKTTTYVLHVVPIATHTHDRRKSIGKKKQIKEKKDKGKKIQESEERKKRGNTRKDKKSNVYHIPLVYITPPVILVVSHPDGMYNTPGDICGGILSEFITRGDMP